MTLTLEKVGQAIGEYSSSLINYGLFLTENEDKAQKLAYKALLHYIKTSNPQTTDRRVVLFKALRTEALKNKKLRRVKDLEKEVLFLELCENFSREEVKLVLGLSGDYWDCPHQVFLENLQKQIKLVSLEKTKAFFLVKHSKRKPHYLEDYYRNLLIDYVCDYNPELPISGMLMIVTFMASLIICFHFYDKWKDSVAWTSMMAPMYEDPTEVVHANQNFLRLLENPDQISPSNQLLTPLPDLQKPVSTELGRTCSLKSQ